ncbi:MAG: hypothetical protein M1840_007200 [Geoglossum simile]|nr:MAG: hypothetical protein M1840_007200 [Geoglossum simile]
MEYRWPGKKIRFNNDYIQLTVVLSRRLISNLDECVIVARGVNGADEPLMAKLRVELDPNPVTRVDDSDGGSDDDDREAAKRRFEDEWAALEELNGSEHTPRLLGCGVIKQDDSMPCPGGYIRALIMSGVPGQNVKEILLDLEDGERVMIETQLAKVLEYMRLQGWSFVDPKPGSLHWDRKNRKLYLIDLGGAVPDGGGEAVGVGSRIVKSFMITSKWSRRD